MNEKGSHYELRDRLIDLLKDTPGFEDVGPIDEDGTAQLGLYDEETGHEFFLTVEPA